MTDWAWNAQEQGHAGKTQYVLAQNVPLTQLKYSLQHRSYLIKDFWGFDHVFALFNCILHAVPSRILSRHTSTLPKVVWQRLGSHCHLCLVKSSSDLYAPYFDYTDKALHFVTCCFCDRSRFFWEINDVHMFNFDEGLSKDLCSRLANTGIQATVTHWLVKYCKGKARRDRNLFQKVTGFAFC